MSELVVCKACGHHGKSTSATKGSFWIEVILWLCFLIPGLIYSIWRLNTRHSVCPKCGSSDIIPSDSPIGLQLIKTNATEAAPSLLTPYRSTTGRRGGFAWMIGRFFAMIGRK
jgi:hypothetical protein